jgi:hydroxypyruvate isomerase
MAFHFKKKESVAKASRRLGRERIEHALECLEKGDHAEARRIAAGNLAKREADNQRNCRSNGGYSEARPAKDPEDQSSEKTSVKACLRRQVRERRIPQRRGKQICSERNASEKIQANPSKMIIA